MQLAHTHTRGVRRRRQNWTNDRFSVKSSIYADSQTHTINIPISEILYRILVREYVNDKNKWINDITTHLDWVWTCIDPQTLSHTRRRHRRVFTIERNKIYTFWMAAHSRSLARALIAFPIKWNHNSIEFSMNELTSFDDDTRRWSAHCGDDDDDVIDNDRWIMD